MSRILLDSNYRREPLVNILHASHSPFRQRRLDTIAQAGIAGEQVDADQLNDIVNHLYNLTPADIALINAWFQRRSLTS